MDLSKANKNPMQIRPETHRENSQCIKGWCKISLRSQKDALHCLPQKK